MPDIGVSYGVETVDGVATISAAFLNRDEGDVFNKKRARQIIGGRIRKRSENRNTLSYQVPSIHSARDIVNLMRVALKPDGQTNMVMFCYREQDPITGWHMMTPLNKVSTVESSMWTRITNLFEKVALSE